MYKIVIPSYQRYELMTLQHLGMYDPKDIYIFVADKEEYNKYFKYWNEYNIIIGEKGIKNQRNFITNYFDDGDIIVSMDDDIIRFHDRKDRLLKDAIDSCVNYLKNSDLGLMTFPPTCNSYFNREEQYTTGTYLCVGVFHIYKNDKSVQLTCDFVEDYERAVLFMKRDGGVLRCWDIAYRHLPHNPKGGLTDQRNDDKLILQTNKMIYKYPEYLSYKYIMRLPLPQLKLHIKKTIPDVIKLPYTNIFYQLIPLLEQHTYRHYPEYIDHNCSSRKNFPKFKGNVFGRVKERKTGIINLSSASRNFPDLYEDIVDCGRKICPFDFNCIQLNKNLVCPPHKDSNNVGISMLVSFGDYEGGNIVVEGNEYDAQENPLLFNGSILEHYNTPILNGTKYSLVYFHNGLEDI